MTTRRPWVWALAAVLLAASCTSSDDARVPDGAPEGAADVEPEPTPILTEGDAPTGTWAGTVDGADALVAVVASSERLLAYVCDSSGVSEWFSVDAPGTTVRATSSGGAALALDLTDDEASGAVTMPDGRVLTFAAAPSDAPALYRGVGQSATDDVLAGWVEVGAEQRGAVTTIPRPGTSVPTTGATTTTRPSTTTTVANTATGSTSAGLTTTLATRTTLPAPRLDTSKVVVAPPPTTAAPTTTAPTTTTTRPPTRPPSTTVFVPVKPELQPVPVNVVPVVPTEPRIVTPGRPLEFVVAGVGDSYGSGEGAPVGPAELDEDFERLELPDWGDEFGDPACHRSDDAGFPVAVRDLQARYPGIDVRAGFFACSGAETQHLVTDRYGGADAELVADPLEEPQFDQVRDFVGAGPTVRLDALYMSIGGNNAGFAPVVSACIQGGLLRSLVDAVNAAAGTDLPEIDLQFVADPPGPGFRVQINGVAGPVEVELADRYRVLVNPACDVDPAVADAIRNGFPGASRPELAGLSRLPQGYAQIDDALEGMLVPPTEVLISHYPDPSRPSTDPGDEACGGIRGEPDVIHLVDPVEGQWAIDEVLGPLNAAVSAGAAAEGWTPVTSHVDVFREGHGICAGDEAFVNTNGAALGTQGDDMANPDVRAMVAQVDAFLSDPVFLTIWTAIGGTSANLPQLDDLVNLSAGVMHPNRAGHRAYADAILAELDRAFVAAMTPEAPTNLRQTGGAPRGNVTLGWDDRSDVETRYEVRAERVRGSGPATVRRQLGPDATRTTLALSGEAVYDVFVRACNPELCSTEVRTRASNVAPTTPTGVEATVASNLLTGRREMVVTWPDDPPDDESRFEVSFRQVTPAPTTSQPTTLTTTVGAVRVETGSATFPTATYRVTVRACNAMGCSQPTSEVDVAPSANGPGPSIDDLRKATQEQFPAERFVDLGVLVPDRPPIGPDGPLPGPDPAPPGG